MRPIVAVNTVVRTISILILVKSVLLKTKIIVIVKELESFAIHFPMKYALL